MNAPRRIKKNRRATVGVALALIVAGGILTFGPTMALNLWDAHLARLRDAQTARWMATHLRPIPVRVRSGGPAVPAGTGVIAPGRDGYLLEIPRLNLRLVVHTLEPAALTGVPTPILGRYGLGQIPYTAELRNVSPGGNGTTAIAGHRTTHGAPFRHLDLLRPGDLILVKKGAQVQQWWVTLSTVIAPTDVDAIRSHPGARRLVLLACTPPFSAKSRLMIVAQPAFLAPAIANLSVPGNPPAVSSAPAFAQSRAAVQNVRAPSRGAGVVSGSTRPSGIRHPNAAGPAIPARAVSSTATPPRPVAPARASVLKPAVVGRIGASRISRPVPLPSTFPAPYTNGGDVLWSTSDRQHERDGSGGGGDHQHERSRR